MSTTAKSTSSLELSRHFAATPERVFDAWLGRRWAEWLPPRGARCTVMELDTRVGGHFRLGMAMPDGREVELFGMFREIARAERLVFTWTGNYDNRQTVVTVTFRPDGAGTLMTLRQDGFADPAFRDGYRAGWSGEGGAFDKLAVFLAKT